MDCPCCGQEYDGELRLSDAVKALETAMVRLRNCHAQEERESEKKLREEFQRERDGYAVKLENARKIVEGTAADALRSCTEDELIYELARRRA